jgi:hypothetical protein
MAWQAARVSYLPDSRPASLPTATASISGGTLLPPLISDGQHSRFPLGSASGGILGGWQEKRPVMAAHANPTSGQLE